MRHNARFTREKLRHQLSLIRQATILCREPMTEMHYQTLPDARTTPPLSEDSAGWTVIPVNTYWGTWNTNFMMKTTYHIPEDWEVTGKNRAHEIALHLPIGVSTDFEHPEALAYIDGIAFASVDRNHQTLILSEHHKDHFHHQLALHGWTGIGPNLRANTPTNLLMGQCEVVMRHKATVDFVNLATTALEAVEYLNESSPVKARLLNALDRAFKYIDTREPIGTAFYNSVPYALALLNDGIGAAGKPLDIHIYATGHAHIDTAWLWTIAQTRQKASRTFHTVLHLMERYPDYHFTQSQPQLYDYIHRDQPGLFERIKEQVKQGRWEVIGGMWVEADCNISGAESLARQFLLGRRYFKEHFGENAESPVLWLPDAFGFPATLPQLAKEAGIDYFFTIKLRWSEQNLIPHDSFWWQGLDGSRLLAHFSTTPEPHGWSERATYNAEANAKSALGTWEFVKNKDVDDMILMSYGWGDGGGGPTMEMLDNIRTLEAFPGMPQMQQRSVHEFFRMLAHKDTTLPIWQGELYLETHQGTLTSQARVKRDNRKAEVLLHDTEFLALVANHMVSGYIFPIHEITHGWKIVCLNQFHDILPGSSIAEVYEQSHVQYESVQHSVGAVKDIALETIAKEFGGDLLVINTTGVWRSDLVFFPEALEAPIYIREDGLVAYTQQIEGGTLIDVGMLPPHTVFALKKSDASSSDRSGPRFLKATSSQLENTKLLVTFNSNGDITSIYDKDKSRELVPDGAIANQFQLFEDRPRHFDAWNIDIGFDDRMWKAEPAHSIEVVENGSLRATLEIKRKMMHSEVTQRISLTHDSARIDFHTIVDWHETHMLLKVAFPVNVLADEATFDIQWGSVKRPTHNNTSWQWAQYEVAAHHWMDLSEGDYGVSVLNDCKYGCDVKGNVMRLSLLKSATWPDPNADQGQHEFTYSLFPHDRVVGSQTTREGYMLNYPLLTRRGTGEDIRTVQAFPFVHTENLYIVIETVKKAEDSNAIVVRFYESRRSRGNVTLHFGFDVAKAWRVNILEDKQYEIEPQDNTVTMYVKPYEIVTLMVEPKTV